MTTHLLSSNAPKKAHGFFTFLIKGGDLSMKKKIIAIVVVFIILAIYNCYLQFGRDIDVVNSFSLSSSNYSEENINVVLNKLIVTENKDDIAENIIQHVLDNNFHTIRFSFDNGYPHKLDVSVYKNERDLKKNHELFSFSYGQVNGEIGEYDISQSDHMELEIYD